MNRIFIYSLLFLIMLGCRKDEIIPISGQDELEIAENVSFIIQIIDEKNNGIPNALLMMQGVSSNFTSDQNGFITVNNISVPAIGVYTTVLASAYHKQIKLLCGRKNTQNIQYIKMVSISRNITIATGSEDWINGRGKLKLPEVLVLPNGGIYQGNVLVQSNYFYPGKKDFLLEAPGNMFAQNNENEVVTLASMGMYRIELFSESGDVLQIRQGDKATLSFPIADFQFGKLDNTIPLWSLNEETGLWIQEGVANLNGQFIVAEVSHFSFWNLDLSFEYEEICFTVKSIDGDMISGLNLDFLVNGVFPMAFETTDDDGKVCGRIPLEQAIKINVSLRDSLLQSFEVGPFNVGAADVELILSNKVTEVKGKALTCEMEPVTNGYGFAYNVTGGHLYQIIPFEENGSFRYFTNTPDVLTLVNINNNLSYSVEYSAAQLENDIDLGMVLLCANTEESKISGYVLIDTDEDGIGDAPVKNHKVLIDPFPYQEGQTKTVYTNDLGYYALTVIPGQYSIGSYDEVLGYTYIGCGDISIDDFEKDFGEIRGTHELFSVVLPLEKDEDNNFIYSISGSGSLGGKVMVDLDNDGVGEKTAQGMVILYGHTYNNTQVQSITTDENGIYKTENNVLPYLGTVELSNKLIFSAVSDYDATPDPDGDDSSLGPNYKIPIRLKSNEFDDNNDFVISINKSFITVRVLEDTNEDGIGDIGISGQRVELYHRSVTGVPQTPLVGGTASSIDGYCTFPVVQPGEYVLYFIGSPDYIVKTGVDLIPDNNPSNSTSEDFFLPVDIIGKEYDDGNTFIVKKN